jgi:hypothetical protein
VTVYLTFNVNPFNLTYRSRDLSLDNANTSHKMEVRLRVMYAYTGKSRTNLDTFLVTLLRVDVDEGFM